MPYSNTQVLVLFFLTVGPVLAFLIYMLVTRFQIYLLELIVSLVVASLPLGIAPWFVDRGASGGGDSSSMDVMILATLPALLLLAGTAWGLSLVKKLGERRTWHRLGIIASGWGMIMTVAAGFPAALIFLGALVLSAINKPHYGLLLGCAGLMLAGVPGWLITRRIEALQRERDSQQPPILDAVRPASPMRLGEKRTWHRLAIIASGWGLVIGGLFTVLGGFAIHLASSIELIDLLIWVALSLTCVPGLLIESNFRKRAAESSA